MKKTLKLKKINKSKVSIRKKNYSKYIHNIQKHSYQLDSPYNTNEYLIQINSSPFYTYNDEEDSIEIIPPIKIKFNDDTISEIFRNNLFINNGNESTY